MTKDLFLHSIQITLTTRKNMSSHQQLLKLKSLQLKKKNLVVAVAVVVVDYLQYIGYSKIYINSAFSVRACDSIISILMQVLYHTII
jgi:hypothetical protein